MNTTNIEKACIRELSEQSLLFYSRAMFRFQDGGRFLVNWHHQLICDELEALERGETENLIINVSPGGSKTHLVSICFPSRGLARQPKSRFLMVSYSSELVGLNSSSMRDLVKSPEFQEMWPLPLASDSNDKKLWQVTDSRGRKLGAFRGASNNGQIMGFRAGRIATDQYYGALILDDVSNPVDMLTEKRRNNSNLIWDRIRSRYGSPLTPTVLIQQRLHTEDATRFKTRTMKCVEDGGWYKVWAPKSGSGKKWRQIIIPGLIDDEYVSKLPAKYRNKVTGQLYGCDDKGRFSYWPEKERLEDLLELESSSPYMFAAQYQQSPIALGGNVMPPSVWKYYNKSQMPEFEWRFITGDTALKAKETSDYTVFAHWGVCQGRLYLIDYIRGKWESPQMRVKFLSFLADANGMDKKRYGTLRSAFVEDAVSGVGLIAECRTASPVPVQPYKPNRLGKWASCQDTLPFLDTEYSEGRVYLPEDMEQQSLTTWVAEHAAFTSDDSHDNDDTCDNTFMAVSVGLRGEILTGNSDDSVGVAGDESVFIF